MRKVLAFVTLVLAAAVFVGGGAPVQAASQSIDLPTLCFHPRPWEPPPEFNCQQSPPSGVAQVANVPTDQALIGATCTSAFSTVDNPQSTHPGNDLQITSASGSMTLFDVEGTSGSSSTTGTLVLGNTITITLFLGSADDIFSGGITVTVDNCEVPVEPQPGFTASGACDESGDFLVTVNNTGDVALTVTVEGDGTFPLAAGATNTVVADDLDASGTVLVSADEGLDAIEVPFEECPPPPTPGFTASGVCDDSDDFLVTVQNTGDVALTVTVEGDGTFQLAPGASQVVVADDLDASGTVLVSTDADIDPIEVPFEDCPVASIDVLAFAPVCQGDIPYIAYDVTVSGTDETTADLTFIDLDGNEVLALVDQPLRGIVIYPGASAEPPDWPGWVLNDAGLWVPDPTDARWRDGLVVVVEVNPTAQTTVAYPPATEACNSPENPPGTPGTPGSTPGGQLPVTGGETSLPLLLAIFFLSAGGSIVLATRRTSH